MADNQDAIIEENVDLLGGCGLIGCGVGAALFVLLGVLTLLTSLVIWPTINSTDGTTEDAHHTTTSEMHTLTLSGPSGVVEPGSLLFEGTGPADTQINLDLSGTIIQTATTTTDSHGDWQIATTIAEGGDYLAVARAKDLTSNQLAFSVSEPIDPAANVGWDIPTLTVDPTGSSDSSSIVVGGEGTPGSTVNLLINEQLKGSTVVGEDGRWSVNTDLTRYRNQLSAQGLRPDGGEIGRSNMQLLLAPAAAAGLAFNGLPQLGSADANGITPLALSGSGEPNTMVNLMNVTTQTPLGSRNIDDNGIWSFTSNSDLAPGTYQITGQAVDSNDGTLIGEPASTELVIPEPVEAAVEPVAPIVDTEDAGDATQITLSSEGGASISDLVTLTAKAAPNSPVTLSVDGVQLATGITNETGELTFAGYFAGGAHTATASSGDTAADGSFTVGAPSKSASFSAGNGTIRLLFPDESGTGASDTISETGDVADDGFLAGSPAVELIVDASWSMTLPLDKGSEENRLAVDDPNNRISVARVAIDSIIDELPEGSPIALRAFGNRIGNLQCQTDLEVALQPLDRQALRDVVAGISPQFNANTAIADSLRQVANDLAGTDRQKVVVLLTDGRETCGGDPEAVAAQLVAQGIDVRLNVVGFAILEDQLRGDFERLAEIGGGSYYDAADADQLAAALVQALTVRYNILDATGNAVATGTVGGRDLSVAPGVYTVQSGSDTWEHVVITESGIVELGGR